LELLRWGPSGLWLFLPCPLIRFFPSPILKCRRSTPVSLANVFPFQSRPQSDVTQFFFPLLEHRPLFPPRIWLTHKASARPGQRRPGALKVFFPPFAFFYLPLGPLILAQQARGEERSFSLSRKVSLNFLLGVPSKPFGGGLFLESHMTDLPGNKMRIPKIGEIRRGYSWVLPPVLCRWVWTFNQKTLAVWLTVVLKVFFSLIAPMVWLLILVLAGINSDRRAARRQEEYPSRWALCVLYGVGIHVLHSWKTVTTPSALRGPCVKNFPRDLFWDWYPQENLWGLTPRTLCNGQAFITELVYPEEEIIPRRPVIPRGFHL